MIPLSVFRFFLKLYLSCVYFSLRVNSYFFSVRSRISLGDNGRKAKNDESKD